MSGSCRRRRTERSSPSWSSPKPPERSAAACMTTHSNSVLRPRRSMVTPTKKSSDSSPAHWLSRVQPSTLNPVPAVVTSGFGLQGSPLIESCRVWPGPVSSDERAMNVCRGCLVAGYVFVIACSSAHPVLYPNAYLQSVGKDQAEQEIKDCEQMAESAG